LSMAASGRGDAAHRMLIDEYESLLAKNDAYALRLLFAACFNAIEYGDLDQAQQLAQAMIDHAMAGRLLLTFGHGNYFLGVVHYYRNELDAAGHHFEQLVAKRLSVHTQAARNGMIGLARVHVARAEMTAAWSVMDLLSQFDLDRVGQDGEDARSLRAQLAYAQGDTESAFRWADGYTVPPAGRSLLWLQNPHLAKAQILLARGTDADVRAALDILNVLLEGAERTFSVRSQIDVLVLRALALDRQGRLAPQGRLAEQGGGADGLANLQKAVELARPGGFVRVFVDLGLPMQTLLLRLAGQGHLAPQGHGVEAVRRILAAFPEPQERTGSNGAVSAMHAANARLADPLTDRELDVLALLRERLSNKEIAQRLCLSPLTVKRYAVKVYEKLGANKRWDAVIKAEALGILPPR
jgi:LuxR family transcriptional regulator, maltose regulon positive regulatory protein